MKEKFLERFPGRETTVDALIRIIDESAGLNRKRASELYLRMLNKQRFSRFQRHLSISQEKARKFVDGIDMDPWRIENLSLTRILSTFRRIRLRLFR